MIHLPTATTEPSSEGTRTNHSLLAIRKNPNDDLNIAKDIVATTKPTITTTTTTTIMTPRHSPMKRKKEPKVLLGSQLHRSANPCSFKKDLCTTYDKTNPNFFDVISVTWSDIVVRDGQRPDQPQLHFIAGIHPGLIGMKDMRKICAKLGVTCDRKELKYKCMNRIATLKRKMEPEDEEKKKYLQRFQAVTWSDIVVQNDRKNNPKVRTILDLDVFGISTYMIRIVCQQLGLECCETEDKVSCLQQIAFQKRYLDEYEARQKPPVSEILVLKNSRVDESNYPPCVAESTYIPNMDADLCSISTDICMIDTNVPQPIWSDNISMLTDDKRVMLRLEQKI